MIIEIKVPTPGESITEVVIANWMVSEGDFVDADQELAEIESDKATLPLLAPVAGRVNIKVEAGSTVAVGSVAAFIDDSVKGTAKSKSENAPAKLPAQKEQAATSIELKKEAKKSEVSESVSGIKISPLAKSKMEANKLSIEDVIAGLRRLNTNDIDDAIKGLSLSTESVEPESGELSPKRVKMTQLRKKIATRLVAVKNETAMLTTFNEVDMSACIALRKKYQDDFQKKHGIKIGFISLFTKAVCNALSLFPNVNAMIDGDDLVYFPTCDIGIAVQTPKGLMVPVIRNAQSLSLAGIELALADLANRARNNKISLDELSGGTFTITNGGVFGSLLSTPILNPPQSGILGMHNIVERPIAVNGKVEIRPMMYLALSYDHRIIDGKDSVGFLVKVKEMIENPERMLFSGTDPSRKLLGLD